MPQVHLYFCISFYQQIQVSDHLSNKCAEISTLRTEDLQLTLKLLQEYISQIKVVETKSKYPNLFFIENSCDRRFILLSQTIKENVSNIPTQTLDVLVFFFHTKFTSRNGEQKAEPGASTILS